MISLRYRNLERCCSSHWAAVRLPIVRENMVLCKTEVQYG